MNEVASKGIQPGVGPPIELNVAETCVAEMGRIRGGGADTRGGGI